MAKNTEIQTKGWENGLVAMRATMGVNYSPLNTIKRNFTTLGTNYVSLAHPEAVESLVKQMLSDPDQDKVIKEIQQINKMMIDEYCTVICFYSKPSMWAAYPEVKNIGWLTTANVLDMAGDTWLDK